MIQTLLCYVHWTQCFVIAGLKVEIRQATAIPRPGPFDFYWGHLEDLMHEEPIDREQDSVVRSFQRVKLFKTVQRCLEGAPKFGAPLQCLQ